MKFIPMSALTGSVVLIPALGVMLAAGCGSVFDRPASQGEAFVGPHTLELRAELAPDAAVSATVHHGDKLAVIERHRRFIKVRTSAGEQGWTDGNMLLTGEQMARLRGLSRHAAQLPSQGAATVLDKLNVHTGPHRLAPSFFQIPEGGSADVVAHRLEPKGPYQPPQHDRDMFPRPSYRTPPDLPPPPAGADDWSLVRVADGRAGWVLTRMLLMSIPDEVAQYAEGHRITSYFALGSVETGGIRKRYWLWTTLSGRMKPYEFDGFRVFVWSLRRNRYETAYIERNLVGYFPVEIQARPDEAGAPAAGVRFSFILHERDGLLYRRTYVFAGQRVKLLDKVRWDPPEESEPALVTSAPQEDAGEGFLNGVSRWVKGLFE